MAPAYVIELMQTIFQIWPQWVPTSLHWYPHLCGSAVLGHPHSPSFRWLHCDTGQHVVSMLTPPLEPICTVPHRLPQHPPLDLDQALAAALKPKWLCYEFMRFDGYKFEINFNNPFCRWCCIHRFLSSLGLYCISQCRGWRSRSTCRAHNTRGPRGLRWCTEGVSWPINNPGSDQSSVANFKSGHQITIKMNGTP